MNELKIIQHSDISQYDLDVIIRIKSVAWPYPYEKHLEWIDNNLKDSDFHLLLLVENKAVAYLNLIDINLIFDNSSYDAIGIGNVCTSIKGKGYGNELMKQTNHFLLDKNKIGLLFCKQCSVNFYKKCDWQLIEKNKVKLSFNSSRIETMVFNYSNPFILLSFSDQPF